MKLWDGGGSLDQQLKLAWRTTFRDCDCGILRTVEIKLDPGMMRILTFHPHMAMSA